VSKETWE